MADYFYLKLVTMDGPFSDDFLDDNRRLSRVIPAKVKTANDEAPITDAARATKTATTHLIDHENKCAR